MIPILKGHTVLRLASLLLGIVLVVGCNVLGNADCKGSMEGVPTIPYTITDSNTSEVFQTNARVAATARRGDNQILIHLEDVDAHNTNIEIEINGPLTAGETLTYDATASYPPDHVFPLMVSGRGPDGNSGGVYDGDLTITSLSDTTFSGRFALDYAHSNGQRVVLEGAFDRLPLQACR
jgi:hypothetical protein